jgi:hypothetical protein
MSMEVREAGQLNVAISNVIATDDELAKLRVGLIKAFSKLQDLTINLDYESKQGRHYEVCFNIPGPLYFNDELLMDVLYEIPLVRWRINYQAGPKGETPIL